MTEGEKIRVIIVDDIAETRENIRKLLQFEADVEVVGSARTGKEGIEVAIETKPDVILMDINMPDMDGIAATEQIRTKLPATQVVILSVQSDSNYMRRAMLAGARDFLTKPPDVDELISAIRRAGEMAHAEREKSASLSAAAQAASAAMTPGMMGQMPGGKLGQTVVVYAPKGGVGSTTITANLAVALHSEETPVVVVDGRLQYGDLSFFFNVQVRNSIVDLAGIEMDEEVLKKIVLNHEATGIKILAAPQRPEHAEGVDGQSFSEILNFLKNFYSYVLVDTSSMLDEITMSAIDGCDAILLLTSQDIPSIKNVRLFLDLANALGIDKERIMLLMNLFDKRRSVTPERVADIVKIELFGAIPLEERLVVPAMDRGEPFLINNQSHPVSKAVYALADKVKEQLEKIAKAEETAL